LAEPIPVRSRIALVASAVAVTLLIAMAADRLLGLVLPGSPEPIIFPPGAVVRHETTEFEYTARINSHGFRDHEVPPRNTEVYRVAAIGDSYTYGWGVELTESWPKVLEKDLRRAGIDVEVLNIGQPGNTTDRYAVVAERAIKQLSPDLVLIAVLQTDDLYQLMDRPANGGAPSVERLVDYLLPNMSRWLRRIREQRAAQDPEDIRVSWRIIAQRVLSGFSSAERARYERLDAEVRLRFTSGDLNPLIIDLAMKDPRYFEFPTEEHLTLVPALLRSMTADLFRIRELAHQSGADVLVVSVPDGPYVDDHALKAVRRLGFAASRDLLTTSAPDELIARACAQAGVPFVSVTSAMRADRSDVPAYFEMDGHPNSVGHRRFAKHLEAVLKQGGYLGHRSGRED
jgi:lysophospholipase L1-like esterase